MQAQQSVEISGYFECCTCIKKHCSCKISSTACMFYLKGWDLLLFLKGPFCPRYNFSDSNSEIMLGTVRRTQILSTARKECCTATIQISHHSLKKEENWNSRDDSVCRLIICKVILLKYFIRTVQLAAAVHKSLFFSDFQCNSNNESSSSRPHPICKS